MTQRSQALYCKKQRDINLNPKGTPTTTIKSSAITRFGASLALKRISGQSTKKKVIQGTRPRLKYVTQNWINAEQKSLKKKSTWSSETRAFSSNRKLFKNSWKKSQIISKHKKLNHSNRSSIICSKFVKNQARMMTKNLRKIFWKSKS